MQISEAAERFVQAVAHEYGYSPQTVTAYRKDLQQFAEFAAANNVLSVGEIDLEILRAWLWSLQNPRVDQRGQTLQKPAAARTLARKVATLKSFGNWLERHEYVEANPASRLKTPKTTSALPKVFSEKQVFAMLTELQSKTEAQNNTGQASGQDGGDIGTAAENPAAARVVANSHEHGKKLRERAVAQRDLAVLELLYATGMRVSELCGLQIADLNTGERLVKVFGKGGKERVMPFGEPAAAALDGYLAEGREILARGASQAAKTQVFLGVRGGALTPATVYKLVRQYSAFAGGAGPHAFRHSAATHMLDNGAEIRVVQEILGHASLASTQVYTHVSAKRLQETFKSAHPRA